MLQSIPNMREIANNQSSKMSILQKLDTKLKRNLKINTNFSFKIAINQLLWDFNPLKSSDSSNNFTFLAALSVDEMENEFKELSQDTTTIKSYEVPGALRLETTNTCNLNCPMCDTHSATREKGYMTESLFEDAILQAKEMGINQASLHTIGEPLVHPRVPEFVEIAEKNSFRLKARTNGVLTKRIKSNYQKYSPSFKYLLTSIDSPDKSTYERIRLGGKHKDLINSLQSINDINKNRNEKEKIKIKNKVVISSENIFQIKDLIDFYKPYIDPMEHTFNLANNMGLNKEYFSDNQEFKNLFKPMRPCWAAFNTLNVLHDGRVSLCQCREYNGDFVVGSLKENTLEEIYKGKNAEKFRDTHRTGDNMHPTCKECLVMFKSVKKLLNYYIYFKWISMPDISSKQFGLEVLEFLSSLGKAVGEKSIEKVTNLISVKFDLVSQSVN